MDDLKGSLSCNALHCKMGGGVSLPKAPLAVATQEILTKKYEELKAGGKDDDAINAELAASMSGIIVFSQVDCDHSGSISKKELQRMLKALPRKKPMPPPEGWPEGKAPEFVPFETMCDVLDSDGDGVISLDEWLGNLSKLPGLKVAIEQNLDAETGKLAKYQTLEERLEQLIGQVQALEAKGDLDEEEQGKLHVKKRRIETIKESIGMAGVLVFKQIDADNSGKIDRNELMTMLKQLPKPPDATKTVDELVAILDVDGDGIIDMDEWIAQLGRIPELKKLLDSYVDPSTGLIDPNRNPDLPLPDAAPPAAEPEPAAAAA